jgi:hypothetical protein
MGRLGQAEGPSGAVADRRLPGGPIAADDAGALPGLRPSGARHHADGTNPESWSRRPMRDGGSRLASNHYYPIAAASGLVGRAWLPDRGRPSSLLWTVRVSSLAAHLFGPAKRGHSHLGVRRLADSPFRHARPLGLEPTEAVHERQRQASGGGTEQEASQDITRPMPGDRHPSGA